MQFAFNPLVPPLGSELAPPCTNEGASTFAQHADQTAYVSFVSVPLDSSPPISFLTKTERTIEERSNTKGKERTENESKETGHEMKGNGSTEKGYKM